jgi:light-regulated signal transduction histidine kinase (bacteriophytochrome)
MNSLLARQIRKNLSEGVSALPEVSNFLKSVDLSYNNFDDQFIMLQRAMSLSSEELFLANQKLIEETKAQKRVIDRLHEISEALKIEPENDVSKLKEEDSLVAGEKLFDYIEEQTQQILKMHHQREVLLKDLAHQNQELSDYAHMVSHDLKSPLRSISTLSTWLYEDYKDKLGDEGGRTVKLISENVEKMDTLISGILEYSTIDKLEVEKYDVDITTLLQTIKHSIFIPENVVVKLKNEYPVITGDKFRLQQLFQNLLVNAVKYNNKEKGIVSVDFKDLGDYWEFHIIDNGKGIEEQYYEKIFQTFQKLENTYNSTGIGLSIVKKIIDLYEGEIWLESILGEGTTFFFTIKKQLWKHLI